MRATSTSYKGANLIPTFLRNTNCRTTYGVVKSTFTHSYTTKATIITGSIFPNTSLLHSNLGQKNGNNIPLLQQQIIPNQQKRSMFIQTATTPNPESIKFIPGRPVLGQAEDNGTTNGFYVTSNEKDEITKSPLCIELFKQVDGIKAIYLGADFITVTKFAEHNWTHMQPPIFSVIMDFYASTGSRDILPDVLLSKPLVTDTTILDTDDEVVAMIKELLETRIRPAVQEDGGDIHYVEYEEDSGVVYVKLAGSCVGCPSSSVTLKNGVENMLMHYIPEVSGVEAIMDEEDSDDEGSKAEEVESDDMKKARTYEDRLKAAGIPFSD